MKFSHLLFALALQAILLFVRIEKADAIQVGLINEDLRTSDGLVITVNSFSRSASGGGLSIKAKEDLFEVSVTLMNTGKRPLTIDSVADFCLKLDNTYPTVIEKGKAALDSSFTLHPGTQSRGNLYFRVKADDAVSTPHVCLKRGSVDIEIICDEAMSKLIEKSRSSALDIDETLRIGRYFLDAGRTAEAEKLLRAANTRFGDDPRLLLQLVAAIRSTGNTTEAQNWVNRIVPDLNLSREDALTLARQAFELESFDLARKVLEPLAAKGALQDPDLLFLGRCWYFDKQFDRAEKLLSDLVARGIQDRQVFFTLGNICDKRNDVKSAISWWEKTMAVDPNHFEALFNIGVASYKQGDKERAIACWKRVLDMNPDSETREITMDALKQIQQ
ncbi:MAG: tetratricopeptide repeat protein [Candidatus Riflebacteria bacterium]|nr:tetratricopeptide repeat protein [Candidatus Riflebacteria bacterium]